MGKCKPGAIAGMAAKKKTEAAEQIISAAFEIGSTLRQNSVQASSLQVGFVLALHWVCFHQVSNWIYFHNPLSNKSLISFWLFGNWVCFA